MKYFTANIFFSSLKFGVKIVLL